MSKEEQEERKDPFDGDYIGNIWGWRMSFMGLGIIVFMFAVLGIRILVMDKDELKERLESAEPIIKKESAETPQDTIRMKEKDENK